LLEALTVVLDVLKSHPDFLHDAGAVRFPGGWRQHCMYTFLESSCVNAQGHQPALLQGSDGSTDSPLQGYLDFWSSEEPLGKLLLNFIGCWVVHPAM